MISERIRNLWLRQDGPKEQRTVGECTFSRARGAKDDIVDEEEEGLLTAEAKEEKDFMAASFQQAWKEESIDAKDCVGSVGEEDDDDAVKEEYIDCHSLEATVDSWVWQEREAFLSRNAELRSFENRFGLTSALICLGFGLALAFLGYIVGVLTSAKIRIWFWLRFMLQCVAAVASVHIATKHKIETRTSFFRSVSAVRGLRLSEENEDFGIQVGAVLLAPAAGLGIEEPMAWLAVRAGRDLMTLLAEIPVWQQELGKAWLERRLGISRMQFEACGLHHFAFRRAAAAALIGSWALFEPSPLVSIFLGAHALLDADLDLGLIVVIGLLYGVLAGTRAWIELPVVVLLGVCLGIYGSLFLNLTKRRRVFRRLGKEKRMALALFATIVLTGSQSLGLSAFLRISLAAAMAWCAGVPGGVARPLSVAGAALGLGLRASLTSNYFSSSDVYAAAGSAAALAAVLQRDSIPFVFALSISSKKPHLVIIATAVSFCIAQALNTYDWPLLDSLLGPRREQKGMSDGLYSLGLQEDTYSTAEQLVAAHGRPPILRAVGPRAALAAALGTHFLLFPVASDTGVCLGTVSRGVLAMLLATDSAARPSDKSTLFAPHASPPLTYVAYRSALLAAASIYQQDSTTLDSYADHVVDLRPHTIKAHIVMHDIQASRVSALCNALRTHCIVLRRDQPTEILGIIDRVRLSADTAALLKKSSKSKNIAELTYNPTAGGSTGETVGIYQEPRSSFTHDVVHDNDRVLLQDEVDSTTEPSVVYNIQPPVTSHDYAAL